MSAAPRLRPVPDDGQAAGLDGEYASDHWRAARLGVPARRGRGTARFDTITQGWLREAVKRWSRLRLATGCAFATIDAGALAMSRFSAFLADRHPGITGEAGITRLVLEDYLSWLLDRGYSAGTRALTLSMLRVFTEACRRHGWLPRLAPGAVIYVEELPPHHDQVARFVPEFVMAQLESDQALAKIPHTTTRHLVVVLIETGLRGGDACTLPFNPVLDDSAGWPCLRFEATKVRAEQLVPLSAKAAAAIRAQQDHIRQHWPCGSPWLFPGMARNSDGRKPYSHRTFCQQLEHWQRVIGLHDQAGQPVTVTAHQFRHTLGTRLINSGVPQHVVQKLLGHLSPAMTMHYAQTLAETHEAEFLRYRKLTADARELQTDPRDLYDMLELDQRTDRILPNGWCLLPPRQSCDRGNACLTCDKFATDATFLPELRQQKDKTLHLIDQRQQAFRARTGTPMSQDNIWLQGRRREAASLEAIITTLQHHQDIGALPEPAGPGTPAPSQRAVRGAGATARTSQIAARANRPGTNGARA